GARRDVDVTPADRVAAAGAAHRRVGQGERAALALAPLDEDRELVAPDAGDRLARAGEVGQARGDGPQQLVARGVPEDVVDVLEAVDADGDDRGGRPLARRRAPG